VVFEKIKTRIKITNLDKILPKAVTKALNMPTIPILV